MRGLAGVRSVTGLAVVLGSVACGDEGEGFPSGPYLGQEPPGPEVTLFAPGKVSTGNIEKTIAFSPAGDEVFFPVLGEVTGFIAHLRQEEGQWGHPRVAPFSGPWHDLSCAFAPEGNAVIFASERPLPGVEEDTRGNLWIARWGDGGWLPPEPLGPEINTPASEHHPSLARDGTLFFYRREETGWDIFMARRRGEGFETPVRLGGGVNTGADELDPFIDPEGRFLLFGRMRPAVEGGDSDLFVSLRQADGSWGQALSLGPGVNSHRWEFAPSLSPDGLYLFFSSNRRFIAEVSGTAMTYGERMELLEKELVNPGNGHSDIYWVSAEVLDPFLGELDSGG